MYRYLVNFHGVNKLVVVEDKAQLVSKCAGAFGCEEQCIAVDFFLEDFGDYASITKPEEMPDKGKIRLRVDLEAVSICSASTIPASSELDIR